MNRRLNSNNLGSETSGGSTVWTDYDGDQTYGDFTLSGSNATNVNKYQPGLWNSLAGTANYLHGDLLGTLRTTTDSSGVGGGLRAFTAFGEHVSATTDRFGYVGAHGYQSTLESGAEVFPFLHLGHRYYDPSSGRFLQRDPIGIHGGMSVYGYALGGATVIIDPDGLDIIDVVTGLEPVIDGIVNGTAGGAAGTAATAGAAANYKWRWGFGRFFNRSAVVCAGVWAGWNGGKVLRKTGLPNLLGERDSHLFRRRRRRRGANDGRRRRGIACFVGGKRRRHRGRRHSTRSFRRRRVADGAWWRWRRDRVRGQQEALHQHSVGVCQQLPCGDVRAC